MGHLIGLPNTRRKLTAAHVHHFKDACAAIRKRRGATFASDHGAMHAWRDDDGKLRFERFRYLNTVESLVVGSLKELRRIWKAGRAWCDGEP